VGDEEFSELVGLIYDAALGSSVYPVMLNRLADALSARCGVIGSRNSSTNATAMTAPRTDPEYLRSFTEYWAERAFIWKGLTKLPVGTVMVREMIISRDEFCRTDYYNEWCKPLGVEATIAASLLVEGPLTTVVAAYRPYAKGDFDATETRLFVELIPHLQRAVQLQMRLAGVDGLPEGSVGILNRLQQGVILVDGEARVIFANQAAEGMFWAGRGLFLGRDGLRAEIPAETRRLRRAIADCAKPHAGLGGAGGHLRISREHGVSLTVLVALSWINVVRSRAILAATTADVRRQRLGEDFGLTPAEAAVAAEVVKADGLQAVSGRLGISLETVRTHLAHVFDKTCTRRQAELIRLLLLSQPAGVSED
jgi:DNA-binding CsgD family transcriptional regulator